MTTTGAGNDFEKATSIARKMVCEWGMSDLGPDDLRREEDMIFLGRELMSHNEVSPRRRPQQIDEEIKKIIDRNFDRSHRLLETHREHLEAVARLLLEKEVISSDEINAILKPPTASAAPESSSRPPLADPQPAQA